MRQNVKRYRGRLLGLAGLAVLAWPFIGDLVAAQGGGAQTNPPARLLNAPDHPALRGFRWREIGPTGQGGRIHDIAVDEKNP